MPYVDLNSIKLDAQNQKRIAPGQDPMDTLLLSSPGYEGLAKPQGNVVDLSTIQLDAPMAQQQPIAEAQDPGFLDRLGNSYDERRNQIGKLRSQMDAGDISMPEAVLRSGLKVAQLPFDAAGSAIATVTPDFIKEPLSNAITSAVNTDTGRAVVGAVNDFNQNHPIASGRIGSIFDAANLLAPFAQAGGKSIISATGDSALSAGKAAGGALAKGAEKIGSAVLPNVDEGLLATAKSAQKYDIPLSLDQVSSSRALKNAQKVSQELPFAGQAGFRDKQLTAYNKALFKTVGLDADKFTPKNMARAFEMVGGEFDALTKGQKFTIGEDFINGLAQSADEIASTYGNDAAQVFQREASKVINDFSGDTISGELIGRQRARINALARKANPEIKGALLDLENAIVDGITSKDPGIRKALTNAKQKYKNLIVLEPLAAKAKGGNISPSQLNNRVSRVYGRAHTTGNSGDIGDLARIGHELLPELGGSDTTQKLIYATGATGGALANAPVTAATLTANRMAQGLINRNQGLIKRALSKAEMKEIMKLPPEEAIRLLEGVQ